MEAGKSYWIRVSDVGVLNIANALAKQAIQTIAQGSIDPKWIKIIVCDNKEINIVFTVQMRHKF